MDSSPLLEAEREREKKEKKKKNHVYSTNTHRPGRSPRCFRTTFIFFYFAMQGGDEVKCSRRKEIQTP